MKHVSLGSSGLRVSRLCLGMVSYGGGTRAWPLLQEDARPIVRRAVESGVTFFDTTYRYARGRSEQVTGRPLAALDVGLDTDRAAALEKPYHPHAVPGHSSRRPG